MPRVRRRRLVGEHLEPRQVLDSTLVFNEIMYDPTDPTEQLEFVELFNQLGTDLDVSRWQLAGGIDFQFPEGTVVSSGGYLVVARDPAALQQSRGIVSLGPYLGALNNGGETLELRDLNQRLMDTVRYDDADPWSLAADGVGPSLAKFDPRTTSGPAAHWTSSRIVGGTPGAANFRDALDAPPQDKVQTLISLADAWRFDASGQDLDTVWRQPDYDDSSWSGGAAQSAVFYAGTARLEGATAAPVPGVNATASSVLSGHVVSRAVDGSGLRGEAHVTGPTVDTMWLNNGKFPGLDPDLEPEITLDLGQSRLVSTLRVWNYNSVETATCCLNRGIALADIRIAGEDGMFTTLIEDQPFSKAPGTLTDFSQWIDLGAVEARYIKIDVDTSNGIANHGDPLRFIGLSEVKVLAYPPAGNTRLPLGPSTYYFRKEFEFGEDPARTTLTLQTLLDDGAVVYLNGAEIYRQNLPAGQIVVDTPAVAPVAAASFSQTIPLPAGNLVRGRNVLAVEVHQAQLDDPDMVFGLELKSITSPLAIDSLNPIPLAINEVAAADADQFFVEVINYGGELVSLDNMSLVFSGGYRYQFPSGTTLSDGGFLTLTSRDHGLPDTAGQRMHLVSADSSLVLSSAEIQPRGQGLSPDGTGVLLATSAPTPAAPNRFELHDEIVINEIMYHHRADTVATETPANSYTVDEEEWIELYNRSPQTVDLSGWQLAEAVDYRFPAGTTLGPDQYLVVARDAAALAQKYPELAGQILGNFSGQLSNGNERLRLLDQVGNPADEVHYYEDGQWPAGADGRGSSLELRDPQADNSVGLAWAASDEADDSPWQTYSYQGVAARSPVGPDGRWQELVLGMLDDGELWLDDIQVIENPQGAAVNLIQNGSFQEDAIGTAPRAWRIIGNHRHSEVVDDPDTPGNRVLRLVATGAAEHMHNHAETTLKKDGVIAQIRNGTEYRISFRAKWITGSNLLNTRLYFNRLARTTPIVQPAEHGTPGRRNSTYVANLGPTYEDLRHWPITPAANEPVTVSVSVDDPQGIERVTLWYAVSEGNWEQLPMTGAASRSYAAQIPGLPKASIVQFYVEAQDRLGATTTFPRAGRDSRALYQVDDGLGSTTGLHDLRMILTPTDATFLHREVELMSNDHLGATIVYNNREVFYDAGVRLSGSQRARPYQPRLSFSIAFHSDQLFRGVHSSIILDRSESTGYGQREHLYHRGATHAGGLPTEYNDLLYIITPQRTHTGPAEAQITRYSDVYLDEQFEDGGSGQLYEYELVYYPTTTTDIRNPEERKRPQPDEVVGTPIRYLNTDDPEAYRWTYLIRNNRQQDDYSRLIEFTQAIGRSGSTFDQQIGQYIDVDQWLRAFAFAVITGHGDNYSSDGSQHNLQLYVRPSDNRVLHLVHDLDAFFDATRPLAANSDLLKLIRVPERKHMYYGHVYDMIQTTFNEAYMRRWTDYWGSLLTPQRFGSHLSDLVRRSNYLVGQIERAAPRVDFAITTDDFTAATQLATITGNGWINFRELRLQGSTTALPVTWTGTTAWQAQLPVAVGPNTLTVQAFDFQGQLVGSDVIRIEGTLPNPITESLRISEIYYHPYPPTTAEQAALPGVDQENYEFLELVNRGSQPIDVLGVHFTDGIALTLPAAVLQPAEAVVVVRNEAAFRLRFGDGPRVIGVYADSRLNNDGERVVLADALGQVVDLVNYGDRDPWPDGADGAGPSLMRKTFEAPGNAASDWVAVPPSPGQSGAAGDVNADGQVDGQDIDELCSLVRAGDPQADLNGDGQLDTRDVGYFVHVVLETHAGDADVDGDFDSADMIRVFVQGEYEDDIPGNSGWSEGDWDCNGDFTSNDIILAFQEGVYEAASRAGASLRQPAASDLIGSSRSIADARRLAPQRSAIAALPAVRSAARVEMLARDRIFAAYPRPETSQSPPAALISEPLLGADDGVPDAP